jgi:hypothetical protein
MSEAVFGLVGVIVGALMSGCGRHDVRSAQLKDRENANGGPEAPSLSR